MPNTKLATALLGCLIRQQQASSVPDEASQLHEAATQPQEAGQPHQQPTAVDAAAPRSQPGVMFWTDGKAKTMPGPLRAAAMATLLFFISWIWIISFLMLGAPFSKVAATLAVGFWLTLLLPCQVSVSVHARCRGRHMCMLAKPVLT